MDEIAAWRGSGSSSASRTSRNLPIEGVYTTQYRSYKSRDHWKTSTHRKGTVVHNENARGYSSSDPNPLYNGAYTSQGGFRGYEPATENVNTKTPNDLTFDDVNARSSNPVHRSPSLGASSSESDWSDGDVWSEKGLIWDHPAPAPIIGNEDHHEISDGNKGKEVERFEDWPLKDATPSSIPTSSDTPESLPRPLRIDDIRSQQLTEEGPSLLSQDRASLQPGESSSLSLHGCISFSSDRQDAPGTPVSSDEGELSIMDDLSDILTEIETSENNVPSSVVAADEIQEFLDNHRRVLKSERPRSSTTNSRIPSVSQSRGPFEAFPETSRNDHPSAIIASPKRSNTRSSVSDVSDLSYWDSGSSSVPNSGWQSVYTGCTVPSMDGMEDLFPLFPTLPCEFVGYTHCNRVFHLYDTQAWIQHVMTDHLGDRIPSVCCCWFCDDFVFDLGKSGVDPGTNFVWRMNHIRQHFVDDGYTIIDMRPDFHFLDHLKELGLVDQHVFNAASSWTEGPQSRITGIYGYNFEPPELIRRREESEWIVVDQQKEDRRLKRKKTPKGALNPQNSNPKTWQRELSHQAHWKGPKSRESSRASTVRRGFHAHNGNDLNDTYIIVPVTSPRDERSKTRRSDSKEETLEFGPNKQVLKTASISGDSQGQPDTESDRTSVLEKGTSQEDPETGTTSAGNANSSRTPAAQVTADSPSSRNNGPRMIKQERAAREARRQEEREQPEREHATEKLQILEEANQREAECREIEQRAAISAVGGEARQPAPIRRSIHRGTARAQDGEEDHNTNDEAFSELFPSSVSMQSHGNLSLRFGKVLLDPSQDIRPGNRGIQPLCSKVLIGDQAVQEHPNSSSGQPTINSTSRSQGDTAQSASSSRKPRQQERKRKRTKRSNGDDGDDGDDGDEEQTQVAVGKYQDGEQLPLACPYYKHNRSLYGQRRFCIGPGWPTVHRVKEHLYRQHRQPLHCLRCWKTFEKGDALETHSRNDPPCRNIPKIPIEGFDGNQELQLKARKTFSNAPEPEKWQLVYKILFPHVPEDQIPSPYYDREESHVSVTNNSSMEYENLRRELSPRIRNILAASLAQSLTLLSIDRSELDRHITHAVEQAFRAVSQNVQAPTASRTPADHNTESEIADEPPEELAEASTLESTSGMDNGDPGEDMADTTWGNTYDVLNLPVDDPVWDEMFGSDSNSFLPSMNDLAAGSNSQPDQDFAKATTDSGYGSSLGPGPRPRRPPY